jgi:hypothetical protein
MVASNVNDWETVDAPPSLAGGDSLGTDDPIFNVPIDFDQVLDEIPPWPRGRYKAKVTDVTAQISKSSSKPMLTVKFQVAHEGTTKTVPRNYMLDTPEGLVYLKQAYLSIKGERLTSNVSPLELADNLIGCTCYVTLGVSTYEGRKRNDVARIEPDDSGDEFMSI